TNARSTANAGRKLFAVLCVDDRLCRSPMIDYVSVLQLAVVHHLGNFETPTDLHSLPDLGGETHLAAVGIDEGFPIERSWKDKLGTQPILHRRSVIHQREA